MIITQTPFRMSFFGGGTDMESFFKEHGGSVLSTTFDKYCYVNAYAAQSLAKYYWIWETNIYYNRCRNSNLSCGRYSLMRKLFGLPKLESENF